MKANKKHKQKKSALIIAHRGGAKSFSFKENSMAAFKYAITANFKMIEFDLRRTMDGHIVVFHNNHICHIKLNTLTYDELCTISEKHGYRIPLFKDVIKMCSNKVLLDIELKESGYEEDVLRIIHQYFSTEDFIITSFLDSVITKVKELNPQVKAGLLIGMRRASIRQRLSEFFPMKRLKNTGADFVVPHYRLVTPWLLRHCKKLKYSIYVWTVNGDSIYLKLIKKRVAAIITDYPERYTGNYISN
jgi:glycerophosphoryl diester phosphodiesterase